MVFTTVIFFRALRYVIFIDLLILKSSFIEIIVYTACVKLNFVTTLIIII